MRTRPGGAQEPEWVKGQRDMKRGEERMCVSATHA